MDVRLGFELQTGLPWSGYVYHPDLSSMSLIEEVPPDLLTGTPEVTLMVVLTEATSLEVTTGAMVVIAAETLIEREAES